MTAVPIELSDLPLRQQRARVNGHDPVDDEPDGPTCAVCGVELDADRQTKQAKTCGAEPCVREHRSRRRRAQRDGVTETRNAPPVAPPNRNEHIAIRSQSPVDVVGFASALFAVYPRAELELVVDSVTVVCHPRGRP
jgi:hypothetical protein